MEEKKFDLNRLSFLIIRCFLSLFTGTITYFSIIKIFVPFALTKELILFCLIFDVVIGILFIITDYKIIALIPTAVITLGFIAVNIFGFIKACQNIYYGLKDLSNEYNLVAAEILQNDYSSWLGFGALFAIICFYVVMVSYLGTSPLLGTMPIWFLIAAGCLTNQFPDVIVVILISAATALNLILNAHHGRGLNISSLVSGVLITVGCSVLAINILLPFFFRFAEDNGARLRAMQNAITGSMRNGALDDGIFDNPNRIKLENTPLDDNGDSELTLTVSRIPDENIYLKAIAAADYDGSGWLATSKRSFNLYIKEKGLTEVDAFTGSLNLSLINGATESSRITYNIEHKEDQQLYKLTPEAVTVSEKSEFYSDAYILRNTSDDYTYNGVGPYRELSPDKSLDENLMTDWVDKHYLDTFGFENNEAFTSLLREAENYSLVEKIEFVKELLTNYKYNDEIEALDKDIDYVENFLFTQKKGYCQHFASAGALMLRYLGVPSRYAVGYLVEPDMFTKNSDGAYSTDVYDYSKHAWVEVFTPETDWVIVEFTPFTSRNLYEGMSELDNDDDNSSDEDDNNGDDDDNEDDPEVTPSPDPTPSPSPSPIPDEDDENRPTPTPESEPEKDNINITGLLLKILLIVLILALIIVSYVMIRLKKNKERFKLSRKHNAADILLENMKLAESCLGERSNETDREYLLRILRGRMLQDEIRRLCEYAEEAAFAPGNITNSEDSVELCKKLRQISLDNTKGIQKFFYVNILLK